MWKRFDRGISKIEKLNLENSMERKRVIFLALSMDIREVIFQKCNMEMRVYCK